VKTERNAPRAADAGDTIPEQANVYVPPRPLASLADHRTMDVKAIRLHADLDPRQALTELRLSAPLPARSSAWIVPVALAVLAIGFIALWWATPNLAALPTEPSPLGAPAGLAPSPPTLAPVGTEVVAPSPTPEPLTGPSLESAPASNETMPAPVGVPAPAPSTPVGASPGATTTVVAPAAPAARGKVGRHAAKPRDPWLE
jgi:hypothetical protein